MDGLLIIVKYQKVDAWFLIGIQIGNFCQRYRSGAYFLLFFRNISGFFWIKKLFGMSWKNEIVKQVNSYLWKNNFIL
jgi:hypothetical protein